MQDWSDVPDDFDDVQYRLQVSQARALQTAVEWYRSLWPRCTGTLYWQLNDCWPVTSWSAIDSAGRKKPLWYATRRFFAPRLLTIQPIDGKLTLCAINDTDRAWSVDASIDIRTVDGDVRRTSKRALAVPARSVERTSLDRPGESSDPNEFVIVQAGQDRALWFHPRDKEIQYPSPRFDSEMQGGRLIVRARTLVRDLCIFVDRLEPGATISDQLVTILPGETRAFDIQADRLLDVNALTSRPVLQSVNAHGHARKA